MNIPREQVEKRAYEIYLKRGSRLGNALTDWLQAEKELKESADSGIKKAKKK